MKFLVSVRMISTAKLMMLASRLTASMLEPLMTELTRALWTMSKASKTAALTVFSTDQPNSINAGAADDGVDESVMDDVEGLEDSRADGLLDRSTQFQQFDGRDDRLDGRASHGRVDYFGSDPHARDPHARDPHARDPHARDPH